MATVSWKHLTLYVLGFVASSCGGDVPETGGSSTRANSMVVITPFPNPSQRPRKAPSKEWKTGRLPPAGDPLWVALSLEYEGLEYSELKLERERLKLWVDGECNRIVDELRKQGDRSRDELVRTGVVKVADSKSGPPLVVHCEDPNGDTTLYFGLLSDHHAELYDNYYRFIWLLSAVARRPLHEEG